jgi:hypothetical protein
MTRFGLRAFTLVALFASTSGAAQTVPQPALTRTTYISVTGADTIWQNVIRTPRSFQSDILMPTARASVQVTALVDPRALIRRLDLDIWREVSSSNRIHSQSASFGVTDDSVVGEVRDATRRQAQRFPSPTGAMIIQGNYLGFLEQLVLRARALGKTEASIPLFFFGTPGIMGVATVRFSRGTDSAIVLIGGRSTELRVDEWGRIIAGKNGWSDISRVRFRAIFPLDPIEPSHCGTANHSARQALSQPSLSAVFAYYKVTATDVATARALTDVSDIQICRDMLDLFKDIGPAQAGGQSLFKVGSVYIAVYGTDPAKAGAAVVYADDLEVAHLIPLGARRNGR